MLFKYHIKSILPSDPKLDFFTTQSESVSQTTEKGKAQSLTTKTQADKNYCSGRLGVGWGGVPAPSRQTSWEQTLLCTAFLPDSPLYRSLLASSRDSLLSSPWTLQQR